MAQQVEQAKMKVQEQTPIVSVLQPVQVPVDDTTSGLKILIVFIFLFAFAGFSYILLQMYLALSQEI